MLQQFSKLGKNRWIASLLFGVMTLSMGLFGLPSLINGDQNVAHVGKIAISPAQLDRVFNTELLDQSRESGRFLTRSEGLQQGLLTKAMAKITMRAQFQQAADQTGLIIKDDALIKAVQKEKAFLDQNGQFSRSQFDVAIRQSNLTEKTYLDLVRGDLAQQQIVRQINSGAVLPKSIQDDLGRFMHETRDASFVVLKDQDVNLGKSPVSDAALQDFYQKTQEQFREPEYRRLTVVTLDASNLIKDITIPESELRADYDRQIDTYKTEEKRSFIQVLATSKDQAEAIAQKARDNTPLEKAAAAIAPKLAVQNFTDTPRESLTPELADAVFKTANGKLANIVQSPFGWHVIQVTGIAKAGQQAFAAVRDQIAETLKKQRAGDKLYEAGANFEDKVNSGTPLEKAGETWGVTPIIFDGVSPDGKARPGTSLPKHLGDLPKILAEGFRLGEKETSSLIESADGGYFILRVDAITPSVIPPLEKIRDNVAKSWAVAEKSRLNQERSQAIVDRLNKGETIQNIAKDLGLKVDSARDLKRTTYSTPQLPGSAIEALFSLDQKTKGQRAVTDDGWIVLTMTARKPGKVDGQAAQKMIDKNNAMFGSDMILLYQRALDQLYPIKINQAVMDRMLATY